MNAKFEHNLSPANLQSYLL